MSKTTNGGLTWSGTRCYILYSCTHMASRRQSVNVLCYCCYCLCYFAFLCWSFITVSL